MLASDVIDYYKTLKLTLKWSRYIGCDILEILRGQQETEWYHQNGRLCSPEEWKHLATPSGFISELLANKRETKTLSMAGEHDKFKRILSD